MADTVFQIKVLGYPAIVTMRKADYGYLYNVKVPMLNVDSEYFDYRFSTAVEFAMQYMILTFQEFIENGQPVPEAP